MSERKSGRDKKGRSVLARCVVICIVAAIISSSAIPIPILAARQTRDTVTVTVNAPEYVEETFIVTIDVDNVTDLNSGQFDLSFDSAVVDVIEVRDGEIEGEAVPLFNWDFVDSDTVRVLVNMPLGVGVSGSGYLAEVEFEVKGKCGDKSAFVLSNGMLVDTEAREIEAEWYDGEVTVFCPVVSVDAPEYVEKKFNATIRIDNVTDFNSGQFDLSFDSTVVDVTEVRDGEIEGEAVPLFNWDFVDSDTVRVLVNMPLGVGVSGSGYLAEVEFEVKGKSGDKSALELSNGMLVNTEAEEIEAEWHDGEVTVLRAVVSVDAPEYVTEIFNAIIRIDNVTDFSSGQFDLSFDSSVVNVTEVRNGEIEGVEVSVNSGFSDSDTVRVLVNMPLGVGVTGSGYLAEVVFEVKGKTGAKSKLDIFNGLLVDTEAKEIEAEWYDDEVTIPRTVVTVDAPEYVSGTFNAVIRIDNVTAINSGQFDLSFNSSVMSVTEVRKGEIGGKSVGIYMWDFVDADTVRVLANMPFTLGVTGSGFLAEVEFEVKGKNGDKSALELSNGMLVNTGAEEIDGDWYDDEVTVLWAAVWVDAPEYVEEKFNATIRIDNVTDFNSGQFDISFNSSVVDVTEVRNGEIEGEEVPVFDWDFVDSDTVRVLVNMPMDMGVTGSGYLAEVEFEVKGKSGDKSNLDISNGLLVDTEAEEIGADWYDDEVTVLRAVVSVDAPEYVEEKFNATIRIDNVTEFNSGQFDLSFNSSVVNVTEVRNGGIEGEEVPVFDWDFFDSDTVRVLVNMPMGVGVTGSGYLAEVEFEIKGKNGDKSALELSNGMLVNTEAEEISADWYHSEVIVKLPSVTIETDKNAYTPNEKQTITITINNPTSKPVKINLGMDFHVYEPYQYDIDLFETGLFDWPANFEDSFSFDIDLSGLGLPEGEYAWTAYLKDAGGKKISIDEAKFSIVAASLSTVPSSPSDAMFGDLSENVKQAVNAELL